MGKDKVFSHEAVAVASQKKKEEEKVVGSIPTYLVIPFSVKTFGRDWEEKKIYLDRGRGRDPVEDFVREDAPCELFLSKTVSANSSLQ